MTDQKLQISLKLQMTFFVIYYTKGNCRILTTNDKYNKPNYPRLLHTVDVYG